MAGPAFPGYDPHSDTHWSRLQARNSDPEELRRTREHFYQRYAPVVFRFFGWKLGRAANPDDLADLVQTFFTEAFEHGLLQQADHTRGRFRVFLRTAAASFLIDEWKASQRQKRRPSGGLKSLDRLREAERGLPYEPPAADLPADVYFDQQWATDQFEEARRRLEAECRNKGKEREYQVLHLRHFAELPAPEVAGRLGWPTTHVYTIHHRLKGRLAGLLREVVAETVGAESVDDELRYLVELLAQ